MPEVSKDPEGLWKIFRCLVVAKKAFGVSAQTLATLRALVSFVQPGGGLIVYASNRTVAQRSEGLSERSIRRHIERLVKAGLLARRDSANRKRYRSDHPDGQSDCFGIDLAPLKVMHDRIEQAALAVRHEAESLKFYRRKLSALLYRADVAGLDAELIAAVRPALRRQVTAGEMEALCARMSDLLATCEPDPCTQAAQTVDTIHEHAHALSTPNVSANDGQNDRHKIRSESIKIESDRATADEDVRDEVLLRMVEAACPETMRSFGPRPTSWRETETHAWKLAEWCGISSDAVHTAVKRHGTKAIAATLFFVAERLSSIRSPGAYFTALTFGRKSSTFNPLRFLVPRSEGAF